MSRLFTAVLSLTVAFGATIGAQDPKLVEAGKQLYATYECKKCHTVDASSGKLHSLAGVATRLSADDIHKWLVAPAEMTKKLKKKPKTTMKKQEFKPGEVEALMAYISTLK